MELTRSDTAATRSSAQTAVFSIPNVVSMVRLAAVPIFLWLFTTDRENLGVVIYAAAAWTDFLDGFLARRLNAVTELGKLLDPLADRVFILALAVVLVARDVLSLWLALVVVARDILLLSAFPIMERRGIERIPVSFFGKCATAALLAGLSLMAFSVTTVPIFREGRDVGTALTVIGAVLYWVTGYLYGREALKRLRAIPGRSG